MENSVETLLTNTECGDLSDNTDSSSDISLSEKIVLESNEKRLRLRMTSLQTSIMHLKDQLKLEKELWREDIEKIRLLQQQQEMMCTCTKRIPSRNSLRQEVLKSINSVCCLGSGEGNSKKFDDVLKSYSIKQLLELQNYKRKLAETENMCNLELLKVKQSLEDLKTLQSIASVWGRNEEKPPSATIGDSKSVEEIFVNRSEINNS